jgi:GT2 family glycosyltransferase
MSGSSRVTVVIPTMGASPVLRQCLEALAADRRRGARIVVVADRTMPPGTIPSQLIDLLVRAPHHGGFAVSCNLGLDEVETEFSALLNDDAVVDPGWLESMVERLLEDPEIASIQGTNLQMASERRIDGCGIAWNDRWQPIQIDHGRSRTSIRQMTEIFGASATAAVFRHRTLLQVATGPKEIFDPRLHTYYDDVDLAVRLRGAGFRSLLFPAATALHAGSVSSESAQRWRYRQLYGNRLLVLARLLGRSFWVHSPAILAVDLRALARAALQRDTVQLGGILQGWHRAAVHLRHFARSGRPLVSNRELRRFRIDSAGEHPQS